MQLQYHLECPDELQAIQRKLLGEFQRSMKELHPDQAPTFTAIIQTRIGLLKEFLSIIEDNSNIIEEELVALVDHKLETEEKVLDKSNNVFDTDRVFTNIRILGWIKYLIIEENGQIPSSAEDKDKYQHFEYARKDFNESFPCRIKHW